MSRAPLFGPGREGRRLRLAISSSFGPRRFQGLYDPASWPVSCLTGAVLVRNVGLAARDFGGTR